MPKDLEQNLPTHDTGGNQMVDGFLQLITQGTKVSALHAVPQLPLPWGFRFPYFLGTQ
jgi:hypothetical protein